MTMNALEECCQKYGLSYTIEERLDYNDVGSWGIRYYADLEGPWRSIVMNNTLSEACLREYEAYWDWNLVAICQKLSPSLIQDYLDRFSWISLIEQQKIPEDMFLQNLSAIRKVPKYLGAKEFKNYIIQIADQQGWNVPRVLQAWEMLELLHD